ncbi:hypothetical protein Tco_0882017 [Tanacetum coccineum]
MLAQAGFPSSLVNTLVSWMLLANPQEVEYRLLESPPLLNIPCICLSKVILWVIHFGVLDDIVLTGTKRLSDIERIRSEEVESQLVVSYSNKDQELEVAQVAKSDTALEEWNLRKLIKIGGGEELELSGQLALSLTHIFQKLLLPVELCGVHQRSNLSRQLEMILFKGGGFLREFVVKSDETEELCVGPPVFCVSSTGVSVT